MSEEAVRRVLTESGFELKDKVRFVCGLNRLYVAERIKWQLPGGNCHVTSDGRSNGQEASDIIEYWANGWVISGNKVA